MSNTEVPDLVEHASSLSFDATVEHLVQAIVDRGMAVFARIDHAANAREAGLSMPPSIVLIYGNAKGGTPVMLATPLAALDLPLRVLVRERDDGKTVIAFHPVAAMLRRAGVRDDLAARLEPAQQVLLVAVAP
ncbi:MAG TPA: DUF302 domain-containing protein [Acetobacteraceae bacterium]|nr:DUF302 domain-containing protein [Acetobacteraceae bacterium]